MAKREFFECDRCGREIPDPTEGKRVQLQRMNQRTNVSGRDLCVSCARILRDWLAGDSSVPIGYVERCSHNIPCAGPCPDPFLERVR